ncbi:hypothetical protein HC823_00975 [Candidatus Gracilibacteria bacterium]|nr:hypothetical protein [Candidatus Gracilibacteria bacterium]
MHPDIVILTSVDYDHVDAFPTRKSYIDAFRRFCAKAKTVIFHADDEGAKEVLEGFEGEKIALSAMGLNPLSLKILGDFNQRNAALALELGKTLQLGDDFKTGLESFSGAGRKTRTSRRKKWHSDLRGLCASPSGINRIARRISAEISRSKNWADLGTTSIFTDENVLGGFQKAFKHADEVGLFPIYEARDSEEDKQFSLSAFCDAYDRVRTSADVDAFLKKFSAGDVVIFAGAGKISGFAREYLGLL